MSQMVDMKMIANTSNPVSRRSFIKGVITSAAAVSLANNLFRASTLVVRKNSIQLPSH